MLYLLKGKFQNVFNSTFAQSVVLLAGGTALGHGVALIATPLLTRIYSPEDFGILSVYISVIGILGSVITLRYPLAIPLPKDDETALHLLVLSLAVVCGMSALLTGVLLLWGLRLVNALSLLPLSPYILMIPVGVFGVGVYQALSYWAIRKTDFIRISRTKIVQSVGMIIIQLVFGYIKPGAHGLIAGDIFSRIGGSGNLILSTWKSEQHMLKIISLHGLKQVASRYREFPYFSSCSALLNSAGLQIAPLLLALFYGPKTAGLFALSLRIIGIPMVLVGQAVAQVFFSEFSKRRHNGTPVLLALYLKSIKKLALYGALPIAALALAGPPLFALLFGDAWYAAGTYTQILSAMLLVQFIVVPLSQVLNIIERQDLQLIWDASRLLLVTGSLTIASYAGFSPMSAIITYSIVMCISYLSLFVISLRAIRSL